MNQTISRPLSLLLALALCLFPLPGCSRASPSPSSTFAPASENEGEGEDIIISVLVDMRNTEGFGELMMDLQTAMPGVKIAPEVLPAKDPDRDTTATRIRTEMMAGKGPDVFVCRCPGVGDWNPDEKVEPFFPFPRQMMENRTFLPLDDYIANAQYMEWDKLLPVVMESGRNDEGQLLAPLSYNMEALFINKDDYTLTEDLPMVYWDMAISDDPVLRLAAQQSSLASIIGDLADYKKDEPAFNEEELAELRATVKGIAPTLDGVDLPQYHNVIFSRFSLAQGTLPVMNDESPDYLMLPTYNLQGGVTVEVDTYAAVNRNTKHPQEAFTIIDFLLKKSNQMNSKFYINAVWGMPVHTDIGTKASPLMTDWYLDGANLEEYQNLLSQINVVNYPGPIEQNLLDLTLTWGGEITEAEYQKRMEEFAAGVTPEPAEPEVDTITQKDIHDTYMKIKMYLAES